MEYCCGYIHTACIHLPHPWGSLQLYEAASWLLLIYTSIFNSPWSCMDPRLPIPHLSMDSLHGLAGLNVVLARWWHRVNIMAMKIWDFAIGSVSEVHTHEENGFGGRVCFLHDTGDNTWIHWPAQDTGWVGEVISIKSKDDTPESLTSLLPTNYLAGWQGHLPKK